MAGGPQEDDDDDEVEEGRGGNALPGTCMPATLNYQISVPQVISVTTVHIFFNTTLDARCDLTALRESVGQNESNDTTPRSLYVGRNFTLYDVTVSR